MMARPNRLSAEQDSSSSSSEDEGSTKIIPTPAPIAQNEPAPQPAVAITAPPQQQQQSPLPAANTPPKPTAKSSPWKRPPVTQSPPATQAPPPSNTNGPRLWAQVAAAPPPKSVSTLTASEGAPQQQRVMPVSGSVRALRAMWEQPQLSKSPSNTNVRATSK